MAYGVPLNNTFRCFKCKRESNCQNVPRGREEAIRWHVPGGDSQTIIVFCQHCGEPNEVTPDRRED